MRTLRQFANDSLRTGAVASAATTVAVAACGELEDGLAIAPINAVSHIFWGDRAASQDGPSIKYTLSGVALNAAAVTSWAAIHEFLFGRAAKRHGLTGALIGGAAISAIAYVTDYKIVPPRFTPGFEKRLSGRSLLGIYSVLAVSLAVGSLLGDRR